MDSEKDTTAEGAYERTMRQLTRQQAMRLLRTVPMGRIAFTHHAMPVIRPVNHLVDDAGRIIIRTHEGASIVMAAEAERGTVVSYEADQIDTEARAGWTVVVTGLARMVDDPGRAADYRERLTPWVTGQLDYIISIDPTIVTAFELTRGGLAAPERCVL